MNKPEIIATCTRVFASSGYDGLSMRSFAKEMGASLSALYHYYPSKDELLQDMFQTVNTTLGTSRAELPLVTGIEALMRQRVIFQFEHAEEVVAVLKYYMHFRELFEKHAAGFLPPKAHLHIEEVLALGVEEGQIIVDDISEQAKFIAHLINGFVLEYYPDTPKGTELENLASRISLFVLRSLGYTQAI